MFRLDGIPAAPRGVPQIEVTFDVGDLQAGIRHCFANRNHRALDEISGQLVELRAGDGHIEMLRTSPDPSGTGGGQGVLW